MPFLYSFSFALLRENYSILILSPRSPIHEIHPPPLSDVLYRLLEACVQCIVHIADNAMLILV
jgi:hypothetical protein